MSDDGTSPRLKRLKLGDSDDEEPTVKVENEVENGHDVEDEDEDEFDKDQCSICLQVLIDPCVLPDCSHEFCFDCILTWTNQSRRCPLCTRTIGPYLIHNIRSNIDYQKYHLPPLRTSPPPIQPLRRLPNASSSRRQPRERWGETRERRNSQDELERAVEKRKWVYRYSLYAKFAASADQIRRATVFIRRELRVWGDLDIEAIDLRAESSVKLLADFLDMDLEYRAGNRFPSAEHFVHELSCFLRSPFKNLAAWDAHVQYDKADISASSSYEGPDHPRQRLGLRRSQSGSGRRTSRRSRTSESNAMAVDEDSNEARRQDPGPGLGSSSKQEQVTSAAKQHINEHDDGLPEAGGSGFLGARRSCTIQNEAPGKLREKPLIDRGEALEEEPVYRKSKGKQRAVDVQAEVDLTTPSTQSHVPHNDSKINDAESNGYETTHLSGLDERQRVARNRQQSQVVLGMGSGAVRNGGVERMVAQQEEASRPPVRIRRSLSIAQAHLSRTNDRSANSTSSFNSNLPQTDPRNFSARRSSASYVGEADTARHASGPEAPVLLARLTNDLILDETPAPPARCQVSEALLDGNSPPLSIKGADALHKMLRAKLLDRMKAERALAEKQVPSFNMASLDSSASEMLSSSGTPSSSAPETERCPTTGTDAARRARLLAKLDAAKQSYMSESISEHSRDRGSVTVAGDVILGVPEAREDALRAELLRRSRMWDSS